ncbi:hypothetical protein IV102_23470 [bacterium]|nr:hypothetical protein [bacterium]
MTSCGLTTLYRQREFHQSPLWRILVDHAEPFLQTYDSRFADSHGSLPREAEKVIDRFVRYGDPRYGLSLFHCHLHMAVPRTLAKPGFAPSCVNR